MPSFLPQLFPVRRWTCAVDICSVIFIPTFVEVSVLQWNNTPGSSLVLVEVSFISWLAEACPLIFFSRRALRINCPWKQAHLVPLFSLQALLHCFLSLNVDVKVSCQPDLCSHVSDLVFLSGCRKKGSWSLKSVGFPSAGLDVSRHMVCLSIHSLEQGWVNFLCKDQSVVSAL